MILYNVVPTPVPVVPYDVSEKIIILATHGLSEREAKLFSYLLEVLVEQMKSEGFDFKELLMVNLIFTKYGEIHAKLDTNQLANYSRLIIYPIKLWNDKCFNEVVKAQCFVEELCHHFWKEEDEQKVNYLVFNILTRAFDGITDIKQIYKQY